MEKTKKDILVVGSGGRCHAIVDALHRSVHAGKIYCAPGNAGTAAIGENVDIDVEDVATLADFAQKKGVDLTIVGPEASLNAGITDEFISRNLKIFGPTRAATRIESSKEFAKEVMKSAGVATAGYRSFDDYEEALQYVKEKGVPTVIKYDGLAAGKGVVVALSEKEADDALRYMLKDEKFGKGKVIIEEYLDGPEFSFMCLVNGNKVYPLAIAQDHKRALDGDHGPNTGGMGAYSPVPFITKEIRKEALERIMKPVAEQLEKSGNSFLGVLYGGLILTKDGPKVIEFNARFGDPETEVVLPRLKSDFLEFIEAVMNGEEFEPKWSDDHTLGIVLCADGYPGKYKKNIELHLPAECDAKIYQMGTREEQGQLLSAGGRILMAVGSGKTLEEASAKALKTIEGIAPEGTFYRSDIGSKALNTTELIDGRAIAAEIKGEIAEEVERYVKAGFRRPRLNVILVGEDPASMTYVKGKIKDANEVGFIGEMVHLPESISEEELLTLVKEMNEDENVDGLLVQLPLPAHIDKGVILNNINPAKDVDGFHPANVSALWLKQEGIVPCTPKGIMRMLEKIGVDATGKKTVVVGRSNIVGLPVAKLLLDMNATLTIAHSNTVDLGEITKEAEILISAVGKPGLITADMVRPGAVVIDIGITRNPNTGKLEGDVDFEECRRVASAITPVPGGVGPMTKACLIENTMECYKKNLR